MDDLSKFGKLLGAEHASEGGYARAASLSPQERSEIASIAAKTRWEKVPNKYSSVKKDRLGFNRKRKQYNFTSDELNQLEIKQNKRCAICNEEQVLVVDHCHKSHKIRGLLCSNCNWGLGQFRDNTEYMEKAILYLKNFENLLAVYQKAETDLKGLN